MSTVNTWEEMRKEMCKDADCYVSDNLATVKSCTGEYYAPTFWQTPESDNALFAGIKCINSEFTIVLGVIDGCDEKCASGAKLSIMSEIPLPAYNLSEAMFEKSRILGMDIKEKLTDRNDTQEINWVNDKLVNFGYGRIVEVQPCELGWKDGHTRKYWRSSVSCNDICQLSNAYAKHLKRKAKWLSNAEFGFAYLRTPVKDSHVGEFDSRVFLIELSSENIARFVIEHDEGTGYMISIMNAYGERMPLPSYENGQMNCKAIAHDTRFADEVRMHIEREMSDRMSKRAEPVLELEITEDNARELEQLKLIHEFF